MLSRVYSVGVRGVEGYPVLVELDLANGLPSFTTVGLPDVAVRESRERVTAAVRNSGFKFPTRRITVNLAPAQSKKQGTQFDLATALAVLSASGQLGGQDGEKPNWVGKYCFVGELALDGTLRPVTGALSMAVTAKRQGFDAIIVPAENGAEAAAAGIATFSASSLREVVDFVGGGELESVTSPSSSAPASRRAGEEDLSDVKGQATAKRALEIAAAGGHNLLFIGPPGAGKSMLARRLPSILPPLTRGEQLELTRIYAASGHQGLVEHRPFRAPHHTASANALIGGGPSCRPGEASLAHAGVLFLDEVAEFARPALEALRQPLEDQKIVVSRAKDSLEYPARFMLVAASNPCPCGWRGHLTKPCLCPPPTVSKYLGRLSGPLLDRIDVQVDLPALDFKDWAGSGDEPKAQTSAQVRARVEAARAVQRRRLGRDDFAVNAYIPSRSLKRHCPLDAEGLETLELAVRLGLSARGLDRALRVARTIADLAGSAEVRAHHLKEAVQLRRLEALNRLC